MYFRLLSLYILIGAVSASYLKDLARYWLSIEERLLSGLDLFDDTLLFDDDALFEGGTPCQFSPCLRASGVNFNEFGDYRCRNLTGLIACYRNVRDECVKRNFGGWQHVFKTSHGDDISLPLLSLQRLKTECSTPNLLQPELSDLKLNTEQTERNCRGEDPLRKYFDTGMINRQFVYDPPLYFEREADQEPLRLTCRYFLSAINEGYFSYRIDKSRPGNCYPAILQRTCDIVDMANSRFIKHCRRLLGSSNQIPTREQPRVEVIPSFFPTSCVDLMRAGAEPNTKAMLDNNRRFAAFVRDDAVFPVKARLTISPHDEAALPPQKCQMPELGWTTLLANQFYKISGLLKKNGSNSYLVEVEVQLFRDPNQTTTKTTPVPTEAARNVTIITVPPVEHRKLSKEHSLAGHGTMRLKNISGVGTLATIWLEKSQTNCALLRYSGLDWYHLRCRLPYNLVSRSFGVLVDGCKSLDSSQKLQQREGDTQLEEMLLYDRSHVTNAIFEIEKKKNHWYPTPMYTINGRVGASSSSAPPRLSTCFHSLVVIFTCVISYLM